MAAMSPVILREGTYSNEDVVKLEGMAVGGVADNYSSQLKELKIVEDPSSVLQPNNNKTDGEEGELRLKGDWVFFPWNKTLLHTLTEQGNLTLRTNRNKNIITADDQKKLREFTVAIAGMSVGSNIATAMAYNGFPSTLKLADFDTLETTNLNRVRARLLDVGMTKIEIVSRQIFDLDPYVNLITFPEGLNSTNVQSFIGGDPKPKLIFEIIDDLKMKALIRIEAKKYKVPLIMLTSVGDSVLIDVERYDTQPDTHIFNDLVSNDDVQAIIQGQLPKSEENNYVVKIVGMENVPENVLNSLQDIGTKLVGRPQLMSTITIEAGVAVYLARRIALGQGVPSGRSKIIFENFLS